MLIHNLFKKNCQRCFYYDTLKQACIQTTVFKLSCLTPQSLFCCVIHHLAKELHLHIFLVTQLET